MPKRQSDSDMGNPREHAAWCFASGIPDNKGNYRMIIPPPMFPFLSEMLWNFGFRHHPDLQTQWVPGYSGGDRNFVPLGVVADPDVISQASDMLADQCPDIAGRVADIMASGGDVQRSAEEFMSRGLDGIEKLREAARKRFGGDLP